MISQNTVKHFGHQKIVYFHNFYIFDELIRSNCEPMNPLLTIFSPIIVMIFFQLLKAEKKNLIDKTAFDLFAFSSDEN